MNDDLDQFLKDTEQSETDVDILTKPLDPNAEQYSDREEPDEEPYEDGEGQMEDEYDEAEEQGYTPRNRRERRLMEKLEAERKSAMQLAERLEARSGAEHALTEGEADYLKSIERIYGTDSPEAEMATNLLKQAITGARDDAEQRAYERWSREQQSETNAVIEAENELDEIMDNIMDTYDVDLTPEQEASYYMLMEHMSPKDRSGNVIGLADPHAVWEVFTERTTSRSSSGDRARELAGRSMTNSGNAQPSSIDDDSQQRFLKEHGII